MDKAISFCTNLPTTKALLSQYGENVATQDKNVKLSYTAATSNIEGREINKKNQEGCGC